MRSESVGQAEHCGKLRAIGAGAEDPHFDVLPFAGHGTHLAPGAAASITLYDPEPRRTFSKDDLRGRSINSPYLGRELPGDVRWTLHAGVATVADGTLLEEPGVRA